MAEMARAKPETIYFSRKCTAKQYIIEQWRTAVVLGLLY